MEANREGFRKNSNSIKSHIFVSQTRLHIYVYLSAYYYLLFPLLNSIVRLRLSVFVSGRFSLKRKY